MSVINVTELATVSVDRRFGEPPVFQRRYVVEVDDPTEPQLDMVDATGIRFMNGHPEAAYCKAMHYTIANYKGSRWHYEVVWDYELPKQANVDPNPLARADIWRWTTGGLSVPALYYYSSGSTLAALTNSAGDFFEGAMTDISTLQASVSGNRATFDYGLATTITNSINSDTFLGAPAHTWKCSGISGQPAVEVVNNIEMRYWQVEVTLEYRPDGWDLRLPNVGWNYLESNVKTRAYVIDPDTGDKVPASNPQPLNITGQRKTSGAPDILTRRVQREIAFSNYFGTPTQA